MCDALEVAAPRPKHEPVDRLQNRRPRGFLRNRYAHMEYEKSERRSRIERALDG